MLDIDQYPLYLMPDFFESLPLGRFFYEELESNQINDDAIGRVLDCMSEDNRLDTIFMSISSKTVKTHDRFTSSLLHVDTSSMAVHGDYTTPNNDPNLIKITYKTYFRELVKDYGKQILEMYDTEKYFVFYREFYNKSTLKKTDLDINWIAIGRPEKLQKLKNW